MTRTGIQSETVWEDRPHVGSTPGKADPPGGSRAGVLPPRTSARAFVSPMRIHPWDRDSANKVAFAAEITIVGVRRGPNCPRKPTVSNRRLRVRAHERRPPPVRSTLDRLDGDLGGVVGGTRGSPADGRLLRRLPPGMRRLLLVRARHPRRRIRPGRLPPSEGGLSVRPRRACRPGHGDRPPHDRRACRLGPPLDRRLVHPDDRPRSLALRPLAGGAAPHARRTAAHLPPPELSPSPGPPSHSAPAAIGRVR